MEEEKSYVGMLVCPICHDAKSVLLDRRLKDSLPRMTADVKPCEKCSKKYLSRGVMLINPENGNLTVIKDSAFKRIFDRQTPEQKIAFCEQKVLERLTQK